MPPKSDSCPLPPTFAVLTAAGSGTRLGHTIPKALVPIAGTPMLTHALESLLNAGVAGIAVTAHESYIEDFRAALNLPQFQDRRIPVRIVPGGETRQASVAAGLALIPELAAEAGLSLCADTPILIHDAARPLTPTSIIRNVIRAVEYGYHAVIPCLPVTDTLKVIDRESADTHSLGTVAATADRSTLMAVQTPQGFPWDTITRAHKEAVQLAASEDLAVTDDAGLVERLGLPVHIVEGSPRALKVTTQWDLTLVEFLFISENKTKN